MELSEYSFMPTAPQHSTPDSGVLAEGGGSKEGEGGGGGGSKLARGTRGTKNATCTIPILSK